MILQTDVPTLVKSLNERLDHILRAELEHQMRAAMKPMIEEAAKTIAKQLRGMVHEMHDYRDGSIHLMVKIDGAEQVIPPNPASSLSQPPTSSSKT